MNDPQQPDRSEETLADALDEALPPRSYQTLPVVGLGGSAGGIEALQKFFATMPAKPGLAFVVILHLSPEHESQLAEVLQRSTAMPVIQLQDTARMETDTVYVIPPGKVIESMNGGLRLADLPDERGRHVVVDLFFRTLADTHGPHAAAVVLSGCDADGAIGIKRIKERGGLTIAQDLHEAEHPNMPRAALATRMVDWLLPVAEMAPRLLAYFQFEREIKLPPEAGPQPLQPAPTSPAEEEIALRDVLGFLRSRTGRDFTYYKRATVLRRIRRRMQVNGIGTLPQYLECLRTTPGEAGALLQDLLISVTNFFRDSEAFAALETHIGELFAGKGHADTVRVWVAACATGEEAYSLGMLLSDFARQLDAPPQIQIFATDLDEEAIRVAREGVYPVTIEADVSAERLRRFFTRDQLGYRVRRELRETVLFAVHDMLKDSPFSRLDLISCRNLLIYLSPDAQKRAFDIFHFALRPQGRLFLGASESVGDSNPLFPVLDKKHRIYSQQPASRAALPMPSGPGSLALALDAQHLVSEMPVTAAGRLFEQAAAATQSSLKNAGARTLSVADMHFRLLEHLAPPSVLVNAEYELLHLSPNAGQFLQFSGGEPSKNLLHAVHASLRLELHAALSQASQSGALAEVPHLPLEIDGAPAAVTLRVLPATDVAPNLFLVIFQPESVEEPADAGERPVSVEPDRVAHHLDRELERLKTHLRNTVEQYETSTQELKASNEELQAMNEELRSATEELETSREELQSINEELSTVNYELKIKVDELSHANSDLHNLMDATAIATIFLDRELCITRYTPSAVTLFSLIPSDLGRPLVHLTSHLRYPDLLADATRVLERLVPIEREVGEENGNWFLARLLPYRTIEDHIAGVVLTFVDITERKNAEAALRGSEERMRLVVENAREYAIFSTDPHRIVTAWNVGAERLLGYSESEVLGHPADIIFTEEDRAAGIPATEAETALSSGRAGDDRFHQRKNGSRFWASGALMTMHDAGGNVVGFVKILRDQTQSRLAQQALEQSQTNLLHALQQNEKARAALEAANSAKDQFLAVLSHELRTPLTPVVMAIQLLNRRPDLPSGVREALELIQRNIRVESHLIDDLLDLTRISRGNLEIVREPVDLHEVVRAAVEISASDLAGREQRLLLSLDAPQHQLMGDSNRLQQVFWNLIKNASKFTPQEGEIHITTRSDGQRITATVSDTGVGIDAEAMPHIFDAFTQGGDWVARRFGGLGLGLSISKATVEAHGGTLCATSPGRDQGSVFTVELPLSGN